MKNAMPARHIALLERFQLDNHGFVQPAHDDGQNQRSDDDDDGGDNKDEYNEQEDSDDND